jgi:hypothetical protein
MATRRCINMGMSVHSMRSHGDLVAGIWLAVAIINKNCKVVLFLLVP